MLQVTEEEIKSRLGFDNPWWEIGRGIDATVERLPHRIYLAPFLKLVTDRGVRRAVVLMGPRRIGKTIMLYQTVRHLIAHDVPPASVFFVSLDNPTFAGLSLDKIVTLYREIHDHPRDAELYVIFDEIQYLKDWEIHLKTLVDSYPAIRFIASGSAAAALRMKSTESGAGRFTDYLLPPLTFLEFLRFEGASEDDPTEKLNRHFIDYLNYGGFPEAIFSPSVQQNLTRFVGNDIIDKVLLRDLPSLYGIADPQELRRFFAMIAYNSGLEVNMDDLAQASGVAKNTIRKYFEYLEAAFLVHRLYRVDQNARRFTRATAFKVYLTNPCLRAALFGAISEGDERLGPLVETALIAQYAHSDAIGNIYYARWPKGEVDIVYLDSASQKPRYAVEVKWSDRVATHPEELRGFADFVSRNGVRESVVLTRTFRGTVDVGGAPIRMRPVSGACAAAVKNLVETRLSSGSHPRRLVSDLD